MNRLEKLLTFFQFPIYILLVIYSYAFVDLNLNLTTNPTVLNFISSLQNLAYYQRPLSTYIFVGFLIIFFALFAINVNFIQKKKLSTSYLKTNVLMSTLILVFGYPFLSYDLFNYMFDAKIITAYGQNPYAARALDFPNDDWVRFMRWVHRYSPYGPVWIGLSLIPSILGLGKFITTLFAFKIFIALFHIANAYLIYRILNLTKKQNALLGTALYALNPLILIEGMMNSHNDVVIATFLLLGVLFWVKNKKIALFGSILIGTLVKYLPILTVPTFIAFKYKLENFNKVIYLNFLIIFAFTIIYSTIGISVPFVSSGATQTQFQPWYLFWLLPYLSLIPSFFSILIAVVISVSALLRYIPYIFNGDWSQPGTIEYMQQITVMPLLITILIFVLFNKLKMKS